MLKLKDIHLGTTDAKNELLNGSPEEMRRFENSFVVPPALNVDNYFNKNKYYVVGLKGTGKTALLRYISIKLDQEENTLSAFVLFKSEVDEDLRKDFSKAARIQVAEDNASVFDGNDFEPVWRWFIYRKIVEFTQSLDAQAFQRNDFLSEFEAIVSSECISKKENRGISRLIPNIRKGNIEISKSPKLGLEFDWDENGRAKVNFNELVRRADQAFERLEIGLGRLNIFFDELELNYQTKKQYQRDSYLVRDLIVSIEKLNSVSKRKGYNVCLYAAIRSEVLNSVDSLGKEINKPIADFGSAILWNRPGLDATQQPMLHVISKRINNAREEHGINFLSENELWQQYFPASIHGKKPQVYVLHNSWYRPRDVVRLLISVQDQYPDEESFNLQVLEAIRKAYSTASWVEITEELKAKYRAADIDGIKYLFYGYRQIFTVGDLVDRIEKVEKDHVETESLFKNHDIKDVVKDLYRIGVLGNINQKGDRIRFSFRGDDEILFEHNLFIHNALKAHLSIFE
ncbi:P-loop ATPase, Sll1717 family [Oceanisphaera sp. KMM 10153]|uniref:P-loop ATPase, Sll1717 family n=1 Tax=Oceanisphaera submarina TaxID=3390193 RepID=UPI0039748E7D